MKNLKQSRRYLRAFTEDTMEFSPEKISNVEYIRDSQRKSESKSGGGLESFVYHGSSPKK